MNQTKATIDHEQIRKWAERRGAHPARVLGTGRGRGASKGRGARGDVGMIVLDFPGFSGAGSLEEISWDEFFQKFDDSNLALVYRDKLANGQPSNFNKLVGRETVDVREHSGRKTAPGRRRRAGSSKGRVTPKKTSRSTSNRRAMAAERRTRSTRSKTPARAAKPSRTTRSTRSSRAQRGTRGRASGMR